MKPLAFVVCGIIAIVARAAEWKDLSDDSIIKSAKEDAAVLWYGAHHGLAPHLPDSFREMEPLFLAATHGCNSGLLHEALHEVYISRIQRGNASFAAKVLGARGSLLSVLAHFFGSSKSKTT